MSLLPFFARAGLAVLMCAPAVVVASGQEPRAEATGPAGPAAAIDEPVEPQAVPESPPDVVLLHNGRVLKGWTRKDGDSYVVERPGAELRLAASSVEMVGRSLEELYARRRKGIEPDDVTGHLALVHWCLRQDLLDEARLELSAVMALEPNNGVAKQLLLRLEGRERLLRSGEDGAGASGEDAQADAPREGEGLFESAQGEQSGAAPARVEHAGSQSGPPYDWPGLPERSVSEFTRTIQPLLINSCTMGGCHSSPDHDAFGLVRIRDPRQVTRRATETNLASVLKWIDPENPNNSEFLAMAVLAHAPGPRPQFTGLRGERFDVLARWIDSLEPTQAESKWVAGRRGRSAAAFQAAMRADAAAPGRRGTNTGHRPPTGRARTAEVVTGHAEDGRVQTHKRSETATAAEGLPGAAARINAPQRGSRARLNTVEQTDAQDVRGRKTGEGDLQLRPGPGNLPDMAARGTPPRAAGGEQLPNGPMLPSVAERAGSDGKRTSSFSEFFKRLNPFRRKR